MSESLRNLAHLSLPSHPDFRQRQNYTYPKEARSSSKSSPSRSRDHHAEKLLTDFGNVLDALARDRRAANPELVVGERGFYLDVKFSATDKDQALQSLEDLRSKAKVELMAITPAYDSEGILPNTSGSMRARPITFAIVSMRSSPVYPTRLRDIWTWT